MVIKLSCRCARCPACGGDHISSYHKPIRTLVVCEGPRLRDGRLYRKQCQDSACRAVVGTNYYYLPDYSGKPRLAGSTGVDIVQQVELLECDAVVFGEQESDADGHGKAKMRDIVFFHDRYEPYVIINTHLFVEVRYLDQKLLEVLRLRAPIEALADILLQTAATDTETHCLPWLPSRQLNGLAGYFDKKGQWLQAGLDLLMILRKITSLASRMQLQQQQDMPRKLFILVHSLSRQEQDTEAAAAAAVDLEPEDDNGSEDNLDGPPETGSSGHTPVTAGEDDTDAGGDMPFAAYGAADGDVGTAAAKEGDAAGAYASTEQEQQTLRTVAEKKLLKGTLDELMRHLFAKPFVHLSGPESLQDHRLCFNPAVCPPGQRHHMLLILDCTINITIRACGVPGCKEPPANDHKLWCKDHGFVYNGCQVAVLQTSPSGQHAWQPCPQHVPATHSTCSEHRHLETKGGIAAGYEAKGSGKSGLERRDKMGRQLQEYQRHQCGTSCWPPGKYSTPQRTHPGNPAAASTFQGTSPAVETPDEVHTDVAGLVRVLGSSTSSLSSKPRSRTSLTATARVCSPVGGSFEGTSHAASCSSESVAVFVGGKARRPLLVCSCAHCGGVVGFDLLWHGAPETSYTGLNDVLHALERILLRLSEASPNPAPDTAGELVVVFYNDASALSAHLRQLASSGHQGFSNVQQCAKFAVDPFRFQPPYTAAQQAATVALGRGHSTPQPVNKKQKATTALGISAGAATVAEENASLGMCAHGQLAQYGKQGVVSRVQTLLSLSPFRESLQQVVWRYVQVRKDTVLELGITSLLSQLPKELPCDWQQQLALGVACLGETPFCKLLARAGGARIRPGLVSFAELKQYLVDELKNEGPGTARQQQNKNMLAEQLQVGHNRLFFRFTPPVGRVLNWHVAVIEVLVDAEAVEGLWRKLQPGGTVGLKTQVTDLA